MMMGRPYADYGAFRTCELIGNTSDNLVDPRAMSGPPRHHSVSDFDPVRGPSGGLQNYYANQRFQSPRNGENEQVMQAKRRMAAQRERELRNYHQEQQYNRST